MSIVVTGGTGFVGIHTVRVLARAGHRVVAFDRNGPDAAALRFLGDAASKVAFVRGDVRDREAVRGALREHGAWALVHAAAITATRPDMERLRSPETVEVNVMGTVAVLEAARVHPLRRIVHVSSGSIYGRTDPLVPLAETAPANPAGLYPISKWAGEQVARRYAEIHGLPVAVARLALPFGPMERDTGARALLSPFPAWIRAAAAGQELAVPDLSVARDYTYAEDVARGIAALLDAGRLTYETYNVGNGTRHSVGEILEGLRQHFPELRHRRAPDEEGVALALGARTERGPLSPERLFEDCGFRPAFDLRAGLARTVEWMRGNGMPG
jgi:UDP-glucuronate 4-epimerase